MTREWKEGLCPTCLSSGCMWHGGEPCTRSITPETRKRLRLRGPRGLCPTCLRRSCSWHASGYCGKGQIDPQVAQKLGLAPPVEPEVTHGRLCAATLAWVLRARWSNIAGMEVGLRDGRADVVGIAWETPQVRVVEVKRTRADLLSDLRARKCLTAYSEATHLYLAATPEAFGQASAHDKTDHRAIREDVTANGLPTKVGILVLDPHPHSPSWREGLIASAICIRPPKRLKDSTPTEKELVQLARAINVSTAWRMIRALGGKEGDRL